MTRNGRRDFEPPSQDSFLDIVANLVGILIILVIIVGTRAKVAWVDAARSKETESKINELQASVAAVRDNAVSLERDNHQLDEKIRVQQSMVGIRRAERDRIQYFVTAVKREIDQRQQQLDESDRHDVQLRSKLRDVTRKLEDLQDQQAAAENAEAPVTIIEHLPTPMAKTVFGKEVHFRLKAGRVAHVPLEELIDRMKSDLRVKIEKLKQAAQTTETIGPMGGFHLQYQLRMVRISELSRMGPILKKFPRFEGFILIPVREPLGELFEHATRVGSQFRQIIDRLNPKTTTITFWVYHDSFEQFHTLKRELFERGFLTASWPLPEGVPIAGGPNGRRSAGQ